MKLGKMDAGIIFRENGGIEVAIPKMKQDDIVNDNIILATAVVMMFEEESFKKLINKQYKILLKKIEEIEAESKEEVIKHDSSQIIKGTKKNIKK